MWKGRGKENNKKGQMDREMEIRRSKLDEICDKG